MHKSIIIFTLSIFILSTFVSITSYGSNASKDKDSNIIIFNGFEWETSEETIKNEYVKFGMIENINYGYSNDNNNKTLWIANQSTSIIHRIIDNRALHRMTTVPLQLYSFHLADEALQPQKKGSQPVKI